MGERCTGDGRNPISLKDKEARGKARRYGEVNRRQDVLARLLLLFAAVQALKQEMIASR